MQTETFTQYPLFFLFFFCRLLSHRIKVHPNGFIVTCYVFKEHHGNRGWMNLYCYYSRNFKGPCPFFKVVIFLKC